MCVGKRGGQREVVKELHTIGSSLVIQYLKLDFEDSLQANPPPPPFYKKPQLGCGSLC